MTQQTSGGPPPSYAGGTTEPSRTDVAKDQAGRVGHAAADAGQQVAGTAAEQAGQVARETRRQARDLYQEARGQVTEQAKGGQRMAADGLRGLAGELTDMADSGERRGVVSDLAAEAANRVGSLAGWLEHREPTDLIDEVRALARRRPGAFLIGCAVAGVIAGRLTRGTVDAQRDTGSPAGSGPYPGAAPGQVTTPGGHPVPDPGTASFPTPMPTPGGHPLPPPVAAPYPQGGATFPSPVQRPAGPPVDGPPFGGSPYTGAAPDPAAVTTPPPAHGPRAGATTVGEYVERFDGSVDDRIDERIDSARRTDPGLGPVQGDDPYAGGRGR